MKIHFLAIVLCLTGSYSFGQQKETVHSIVVIRHEASWYETQMKLWKADVEKDNKNAEAWYNYYSAVRALGNLSEWGSDKRKAYTRQCTEIAKAAYAAIPETFEGNHLMHWDQGVGVADPKYLEKAYQIAPGDPRLFDDIMILAEMNRNKERFHEIAVKIYETGQLPGAMLNWGYNILSELDENAILFAAGDNDTYALWLTQEALGFRKDVQVMNTFMIRDSKYRNRLLSELGIPSFEMEEEKAEFKRLYEHILQNDKGIPVYISTSAIRQFEKWNTMDDLYLTGLSYRYTKESFDNISLIRRNYEKRFLVDHLRMTFQHHIANERAIHFNGLYLPMLLKLAKHYKTCEESAKSDEMIELIKKIGRDTHREDEIKEHLKEL